MPDPRKKYAVRELSIGEGQWHDCTSEIVAVLQSSFNSAKRTWYLTALIQRSADPTLGDIEEE